jgi:hypothetical protein
MISVSTRVSRKSLYVCITRERKGKGKEKRGQI